MTLSHDTIGQASRPARGDTCASDAVPGKVAVRFVAADDPVAGIVLARRTSA